MSIRPSFGNAGPRPSAFLVQGVTGKLPPGAGKFLVANALAQQEKHEEFLDEYNETSALIGKTSFEKDDPTAVYTFGVDKRDLTFHRHAGHRVITGITGGSGCLLKFSLCTVKEAMSTPPDFRDELIGLARWSVLRRERSTG